MSEPVYDVTPPDVFTRRHLAERAKAKALEVAYWEKRAAEADQMLQELHLHQQETGAIVLEPAEDERRWSLRDEGRNPDGTGESYSERNS